MAFDHEKRTAARLLDALENAALSPSDTRSLLEDADPALVYFVFAWLRDRYRPGHSASEGVLGRLVEQLRESPAIARKAKQGEKDALVSWFEDSYEYRELDRVAFIDLIVEKLEG